MYYMQSVMHALCRHVPKNGLQGRSEMGGMQMEYHECMQLGGQQQFHAALLLNMKVVLRILNVLNVRVPFPTILKGCTVPKGCLF